MAAPTRDHVEEASSASYSGEAVEEVGHLHLESPPCFETVMALDCRSGREPPTDLEAVVVISSVMTLA